LVERNLAKVEVASSSLVSRSNTSLIINDLEGFWESELGHFGRGATLFHRQGFRGMHENEIRDLPPSLFAR
jgi:hypothetical protein